MLIEIEADNLLRALSVAVKITSKKTANMITSTILLDATNNGLSIKANNLENTFSANIEASVSKTGLAVIDAAKFRALIATYKHKTLVLKADKRHLTIAYEKSSHKLSLYPFENFPKVNDPIENVLKYKLSTTVFLNMLKRVLYTVESVESKPYLSGVNVLIKSDEIRLIATNTKRIAQSSYSGSFREESSSTMPKGILSELVSILPADEDLYFGYDNNHYYFSCGSFQLSTVLLAQKFPDLSKMFLDKNGNKTVVIDREELLQALIRTNILADKESKLTEFVFTKSQLSIKVDDELGSSDEVINIDNDEEFSVLFRLNYLVDFLNTTDNEKILFVYNTEKSRFSLLEIDSVYNGHALILPARL